MQKKYLSLGLMSGTSGDGVDASLIYSNGINQLEVVKDKYFEYETNIYQSIHSLKERIFNINHLKQYSNELQDLERKITIFHAKIINDFKVKNEDFLVGFHGQTIFHSPKDKLSKQLGDGQLLNQLTKKKIIFNFRKNDILNGGEGAPLTPIFHQLLTTTKNLLLPSCFLNIGGISNITIVNKSIGSAELFSKDIGPGNCLIDNWMRKNTNKKFDNEGKLASIGKKDQIIFEQAQELYSNRLNKEKLSLDINDFDISFARGLSLEDGVATLTDFTASIIGEEISSAIVKSGYKVENVLICGGGRKNSVLIKKIKDNSSLKLNFKLIDSFEINGDFVESQAFAFLAIRSILKLPISFPSTTGCTKPCSGGELIKN